MRLEVTPSKGKSFLKGSLYRNPAEKVELVDRFENCMDLVFKERKEIILVGDFNKDLLNSNVSRDWAILLNLSV